MHRNAVDEKDGFCVACRPYKEKQIRAAAAVQLEQQGIPVAERRCQDPLGIDIEESILALQHQIMDDANRRSREVEMPDQYSDDFLPDKLDYLLALGDIHKRHFMDMPFSRSKCIRV
jgi:hypothetical protein